MADRYSYSSLSSLKSQMGITDTTDDTLLLEKLESASKYLNGPYGCNRHFYAKSATRYYTGQFSDRLLLNADLLSITSLKTDEDGDRTYERTWAVTDYDLMKAPGNYNDFPYRRIEATPNGDYSFPNSRKGIEIIGLWGYGDGASATPYTALATTATVATTTGTTITTSAATGLAIGQTWLVESEQMFATAGSSTSWTVVRGVNGTTAATHTTKAISVYQYPAEITEACILVAVKLFRLKDAPFGVLGQGESGNIMAGRLMDVRIQELIADYREITVA